MQSGVMVFGCVKRKLRCVSVQDYFYDSAKQLASFVWARKQNTGHNYAQKSD